MAAAFISVNAIAASSSSIGGGESVCCQALCRVLLKSRNDKREDLLDTCRHLFSRGGQLRRMKVGCGTEMKFSFRCRGYASLYGLQTRRWKKSFAVSKVEETSKELSQSDGGMAQYESVEETSKELSQSDGGMAQYESLKEDLFRLTRGTALACTIYALLTVSLKAAASYGIGALGSWLYMQLLVRHVDKVSREDVPEIFRRKKYKRIGIDSRTVSESLEKAVRGMAFSLRNERLLVPAGLMLLGCFSQSTAGDKGLHLEVMPLMLGFFAYKGAVLFQTLQDNKNLLLEWDNEEDSDSRNV